MRRIILAAPGFGQAGRELGLSAWQWAMTETHMAGQDLLVHRSV